LTRKIGSKDLEIEQLKNLNEELKKTWDEKMDQIDRMNNNTLRTLSDKENQLKVMEDELNFERKKLAEEKMKLNSKSETLQKSPNRDGRPVNQKNFENPEELQRKMAELIVEKEKLQKFREETEIMNNLASSNLELLEKEKLEFETNKRKFEKEVGALNNQDPDNNQKNLNY